MKYDILWSLAISANICMLLFCWNVSCHPTIYKHDRNVSCYLPAPTKIYSWHVHVLYNDKQAKMQKQALAMLEKFKMSFEAEIGPECKGLFHQDHLCIFNPETTQGPFPVAQWAIFLPMEHYASIVPWFMQNRVANGISLDVLLHPNSGCEVEDHSWWAMWGGEKWRLNMDALSYDQPYPWN